MTKITTVVNKFYNEYKSKTSKKLKIIDAYLLYILLTGAVQFFYCLLVGTFPFNSFLSGFISSVCCFVLAGKCYIQRFNFTRCRLEQFGYRCKNVKTRKNLLNLKWWSASLSNRLEYIPCKDYCATIPYQINIFLL